MRIKFCNIKMEKVKSEKGFTLLELIFVTVVTGILSSTLILPFLSSIRQGTRPEIYATATYLAKQRIEEQRSLGYTSVSGSLGTSTSTDTKKGRTYNEQVVTKYVDHDDVNDLFVNAVSPPTEFINVTVTVSNADIPYNVSMWTILAKDFYDPNAN